MPITITKIDEREFLERIKMIQTTDNLAKEVLKKKSSLDDEKQEEVQNADNNN
jgi:hypothetical protein